MQGNVHVFQGMRRDSHPINQESKYLWDAHNVRLTTRNDNTLLSITNEKSTKHIMSFNKEELYIGHSIVGNYLVLFTHIPDKGLDHIYRINLETLDKKILYQGNLNLHEDHPIQAIADFESELIQKVYWTDNYNPPRMINVSKPELKGFLYRNNGYTDSYKDAPFNFLQELSLGEKVSIKKIRSNVGIFPSGIIQYALTYVHKYGQESNIFYTSPIQYLSYADRGGSPEDRINISFEIKVTNIDSKFDYIRVYSIVRTSLDSIPTVKRVCDCDLNILSNISFNSICTIIDNGTTGDIIDPSYLLYVGGKDILAGCIHSKDNTLFLGNITYKRQSIANLDIKENNKLKFNLGLGERASRIISHPSIDKDYFYYNQLNDNTCTFKSGETYRMGCRFQYKTGEWSEPIWIKDYKFNTKPAFNFDTQNLYLGEISGYIPLAMRELLLNAGYKRIQPLIVRPTYKDRTIIAQGILCPTVGNVGNRATNNGAYAQSSWLLRPYNNNLNEGGYNGSTPLYMHNYSLPMGNTRNVELQNMAIDNALVNPNNYLTYDDMTKSEYGENYYGAFVVDQSIVTMHSPDIEFGDIDNIINSGTNIKVKRIGYIQFDNNRGEIDIQTSTPTINSNASGFIKRGIIGDGGKSLISGLFYEDSSVEDREGGKEFKAGGLKKLWMTYMWNRTGSLNNDCTRPDNLGTRSAVLSKKCITNMKVSNTTTYDTEEELNFLDIKSFSSNEVSLIKLKIQDKIIAYYGNVDTLIPSYTNYNYMYTASVVFPLINHTFTLNGITYGKEDKVTITINNARGTSTYVRAGDKYGNINCILPYNNTTVDVTNKAILSISIYDRKFTGVITSKEDITAIDGTFIKSGYSWYIKGETDYFPIVDVSKIFGLAITDNLEGTPLFTEEILTLGSKRDSYLSSSVNTIGNYYKGLKSSKEGIRMKYKSTPHVVISLDKPLVSPVDTNNNDSQPRLVLAELIQEVGNLRYGGTSEEAINNNIWIPAGPTVSLDSKINTSNIIKWIWGDTWFQRYDCLKTYPFTFDDINQVTEIGSFFCETRINLDGRYDRNRNNVSFYLSPHNFNKINPVYSQLDSFFTSRSIDKDFYKVSNYPSQFVWSQTKNPASINDIWTNINLASTYDLDGSYGRLSNIQSFNELLVGFQETSMSQILFNSRVQLQVSDGVPIEIANSQKLEGTRIISNNIGCQDKYSMVTTPLGIYFIDTYNTTLYKYDGQIHNLSNQLGSLYWARDNKASTNWTFLSKVEGNPGVRLYYDSKYNDVYFTPSLPYNKEINEALCFSEQLNNFTSNLSYGGAVMFSWKSQFYSIALDRKDNSTLCLWKNFEGYFYNNIFNAEVPYSISFISNDNPTITKVFDTLEMHADLFDSFNEFTQPISQGFSHINQVGKPFNTIKVFNEYQNTLDVEFTDKTLRKKFRIWRAILPRNGKRDRIINPWCNITLSNTEPGNNRMILHNISVGYTI